ncbi:MULTISPECIES: type II toxin-antitoxin system HicB family antitoxin [unclassified Granulicatella]|uniref:type II toxin-antitoxin system HicB family antitoxin n=1 Tax=unclassified Granulicatella TaxID=2630493 RepID=UPI001073F099|nr:MULTISPECIES: type II toxin-antitoxin system HicB family antitoxin [unclassified Granulicatella]MBF0780524.1 type II toxin-antitoxin system HicB family antitoxin [Granulicatella sp. 19428wC4_WM01]TFU95338.1 HicB family protein [Granulicatella sp. WM01]
MLKSYPALFHKMNNGFWVEIPGFGGGTQGEDIEEAIQNAIHMLSSAIAIHMDEGIPLPKTEDINSFNIQDGFVTMIQANPVPFLKNGKTVRKNVTVPEWIVKMADKTNVNYSEVLTNALREKLNV